MSDSNNEKNTGNHPSNQQQALEHHNAHWGSFQLANQFHGQQGNYQVALQSAGSYVPKTPSYFANGPVPTQALQNPTFHQNAVHQSRLQSLPPLSENDEEEFPETVSMPTRARPVSKTAGARHTVADPKGKGKQREVLQPVVSGSKRKVTITDNSTKAKKGRLSGAANYSLEDLDALFDILEENLPLGGAAWNSATDEFNVWAEENGRPTRTPKSLELKFKQVVKTTKPTGDAECPPYVVRAQIIDDMMNDKAGSRELDDTDIIDVDAEENSEDEPEIVSTKVEKKKVIKSEPGPIARRPPSDRLTTSVARTRQSPADILSTISSALDPRLRQARDHEHSLASMQASQIFQLTNQVCDLQRQLDGVQNQLSDAERRCNIAERRADCAEVENLFHSRATSFNTPTHAFPPSHHHSSYRRHSHYTPEYRSYTQDNLFGDVQRRERAASPPWEIQPPTSNHYHSSPSRSIHRCSPSRGRASGSSVAVTTTSIVISPSRAHDTSFETQSDHEI